MKLEHWKLHEAVHKGQIERIRSNDFDPQLMSHKFPPRHRTPLHLAAKLGNWEMVEELLKNMNGADLELQDAGGNTALHFAAASGQQQLAERMVQMNPKLLRMVNKRQMTPLREACGKNHKELATCLYSQTSIYWLYRVDGGKLGSNILKCCILAQMFDIAVDMLMCYPDLATIKDAKNSNAAIQLSLMPHAFPSGTRLHFWQRWIYSLIHVTLPLPLKPSEHAANRTSLDVESGQMPPYSPHEKDRLTGPKTLNELKRVHICSAELLRLTCQHMSSISPDSGTLRSHGVFEAFHKAIENGIVEFVQEAIRACPALLHKFDKDGRSVFMTAVQYRQEKIFNLLYPLPEKASIVSLVDKDSNTMLHMAGVLSPSTKLSRISGAALQMQRELQWFEEVERVINPMYKENTNKEGETARQIFTRTHRDLAAAGEKWMKETATSSSVVAALIITIMFTAAFTPPGGSDDKTGLPNFLKDRWFRVFILSDSISLFAASTSVLMFLGIFTSRYSEQDFLRSLPTKLIIGLSALFVSIAAMMLTFCATIVIVMDRNMAFVFPITLMASVPVTLFIKLQFPVLLEIFNSTYGFGIFRRNTPTWI
ncbi:unnamed protein product [Linum tenue]|uniref:PGG domain-containing protein n=1 Tax=Linum tenue TaxID=586396 RepID=A0AAV0IUF2_9ROSI|nr:unnamed protein product [Linum tenue]